MGHSDSIPKMATGSSPAGQAYPAVPSSCAFFPRPWWGSLETAPFSPPATPSLTGQTERLTWSSETGGPRFILLSFRSLAGVCCPGVLSEPSHSFSWLPGLLSSAGGVTGSLPRNGPPPKFMCPHSHPGQLYPVSGQCRGPKLSALSESQDLPKGPAQPQSSRWTS